jgi:GT2 family glycosyltransferase
MPVVLQNEILLAATVEAAASLSVARETTLFVICNRLSICSPESLHRAIAAVFAGRVEIVYEPYVERTVAGAWNEGCRRALAAGAEYIAIVANDTRLKPDCLDRLVSYASTNAADLCSGISWREGDAIDPGRVTDGADFSCFMIRPETLQRFGLFDPNYRPAYFEDNDYYARVVLGGGSCHVVHAAQFFHHGSLTLKSDSEMGHHVRYWFEKNRSYFQRKWGVSHPENTADGVRTKYYHHPFDDPSKPLCWFPDYVDSR